MRYIWGLILCVFLVPVVYGVSPTFGCDEFCVQRLEAKMESDLRRIQQEAEFRESDARMARENAQIERNLREFRRDLREPTVLDSMVIQEMPGTTYQHPQPRYRYRGYEGRYGN